MWTNTQIYLEVQTKTTQPLQKSVSDFKMCIYLIPAPEGMWVLKVKGNSFNSYLMSKAQNIMMSRNIPQINEMALMWNKWFHLCEILQEPAS